MEKKNEEKKRFDKIVFSDHDEELSSSRDIKTEASIEEPATCGSEHTRDVKTDSEHATSHSQSVIFETDRGNSGRYLGLNLDTPKPESPTQAGDGSTAAAGGTDDKTVQYEDSLQDLDTQRDEARKLNRQLQMKLAEYFHNTVIDGGQQVAGRPEEEQRREYERSVQVLSELKQQLSTASQEAQRQAEELRSQARDKLGKVEQRREGKTAERGENIKNRVEAEWELFLALKRDAALAALSPRLGTDLARSKVQAVLTAEQLRQNQLTRLRLKHFSLRSRIQRLEAELRGQDPQRVQAEQLQASLLERKKQAGREREESRKLQRRISSSLEVLSNVREKLLWSQAEVRAKRQQLAEVEVLVAERRNVLTQARLERNRLQRANGSLNQRCGLLGDRDLLLDLERTLGASQLLEKHLEELRLRKAEVTASCGVGRGKDGIAPNDCCFTFFRTPVNKNQVSSYYRTDSRCPTSGVILITSRERRICVDVQEQWVKNIIKHLERKTR
ncbi:coiled-coil domain-containing protein 96-like [Gambusia affinis]|uniref:coiled-coil domain-containing protein 96-like n=1 Tax=Gambusia affinis TaxID=33528 RepID=UPI001CDCDB22|nr:coiled-coil domain-containing protein 96-like [Gambusia affinis]